MVFLCHIGYAILNQNCETQNITKYATFLSYCAVMLKISRPYIADSSQNVGMLNALEYLYLQPTPSHITMLKYRIQIFPKIFV